MPIEIWILIIALVGLYLGFSYLIYLKMIRHGGFHPGGLVDQSDPFFQPSFDWYTKVVKESVHIQGYDGVRLNGVFIPSIDDKSTHCAIVVHGYQGCHTDMAVIAKEYSDLGFKILLIDLRGHGMSEGTFSTFGIYERYDIKKWIQYVLRTYGATDQILLHGVSMGAASVIMTTALDIPDNVKLVVADSAYASITPVFIRKFKSPLGILFLPGISLVTYYFHHFFLMNLSVKRVVKTNTIPIAFLHGMKDELCPYRQTLKMMESSKASFKDIYSVLSAKHAEGYILEKSGVDAWLKTIISQQFDIKIKKTKI